MPSRFSILQGRNLKPIKLAALLLLTPLFFYGQSLTGLWTGALSNDSTTVRKDQLFEIALTEYKGKVYGYSRSEFIVNDTLYYIIKRVKGTINGDICEVTDDDIIAFNFRGKLDKGIKVTSTFKRNNSDSSWYLAGTWKTNATKKYYSVTGKVDLGQEKDLTASKIFPHLEELKIADEISFYKERNEAPAVARLAKPQRVKTEYTFNNDPAPAPAVAAPELVRADPESLGPDLKKPDNAVAKTKTKEINNQSGSFNVAAPELVRTDPEATGPDLKKPDAVNKKTQTKEINNQSHTLTVAAPELVRTDPEATGPDLKKPDAALTKTDTKLINGSNTNIQIAAPAVQRADPELKEKEIKRNEVAINRTDTKNVDGSTVALQPAASSKTAAVNKPVPAPVKTDKALSTNASKNNTIPAAGNNNNPTTVQKTTAAVTPPASGKTQSVTATNPPVANNNTLKAPMPSPDEQHKHTETARPVSAPLVMAPQKTIEELTKNVATIAGRKSEFSQVVDFKADSLVLSLYDNGEIDGDTVSVIMNGETIMAKQGIKASAIRKTIYIQPGQNEDFTLVLFADNLGKYPPNTGLLVVHDGEDVYHLRFSSDFQKSTGIVFRRKK
jgi:hypothetical protein